MTDSVSTKSLKMKINHFCLIILLIAIFNYAGYAFGYNLIDMLHVKLNELLKMETYTDKVIYAIILLAGLIIFTKKSIWLPFLHDTVFPSLAFIQTVSKKSGDVSVPIKVTPNTRIAYWASLPQKSDKIPDVINAYGDFSNSGIAVSDKNGNANLLIDSGSSYSLPSGRVLQKHIHYRELDLDYGFLGPVMTVYY
jgi:hypothetical protein